MAGTPVVVGIAASGAAATGGASGYFILDDDGADAGSLLWDPTGGAGTDASAIAVLSGVTSLSATDFVVV